MQTSGIGPILASIQCRYKFPLTYPDTVRVGVRVGEVGVDRFTMLFRIVSTRHRRIAAEGDSVIVSYDYRLGTKVPLPGPCAPPSRRWSRRWHHSEFDPSPIRTAIR